MRALTIIGCGKVGKTLGALWARQDVFRIHQLFNRTEESAREAARMVEQGTAVWEFSALEPADMFLIATPDRSIVEVGQQLAKCGLLAQETILFHCSGALPSSALRGANETTHRVASVHPVKSLADVEGAIATFPGAYCGMEGDSDALRILEPAFEAIGGIGFTVDPQQKTLYHAASVLVCNYLTALLEVGIQTYAEAGLSRDTAMKVMEPIVRGALDNVFQRGTVNALTGPIARGDQDIVIRQRDALRAWNPSTGQLYTLLGCVAVDLAKQQSAVNPAALDALKQALLSEAD